MNWVKIFLLLVCCSSLAGGCVKVSNIVLLDNKTALEQQASGEYSALEAQLEKEGIYPKAKEFAFHQLEKNVWLSYGEDSFAAILDIYRTLEENAEQQNNLLIKQCIGEASTGLLMETPANCRVQNLSTNLVESVINKTNQNRRQLWEYIATKRGVSPEKAQAQWHKTNLQEMVCSGQFQDEQGKWQVKKCE